MTSEIRPQPNVAELTRTLTRSHLPSVKRAAADALRELGAPAVEPLCALLKHHDKNVRARAAEILGDIGDARVAQPLLDALRDCFLFRSSRWQLVIGFTIVPLVILLVAAVSLGVIVILKVGCAVWGIWRCIFWLASRWWDGRPHELAQSIVNALAKIAEREPTPELRAAIPDLERLAADVMQQKRQTREIAHVTARRIADLTQKLKSLPIPASAPAPDVAQLPIPASAPTPDTTRLPRPGQMMDPNSEGL